MTVGGLPINPDLAQRGLLRRATHETPLDLVSGGVFRRCRASEKRPVRLPYTPDMTDAVFPVQTVWNLNPSSVPMPVNQILIQGGGQLMNGVDSNEYFLTLGHVNPPAILPGSDGTIPTEALQGVVLPITPVGQFTITRERLQEFRAVLDEFLDRQ